FERLADPAVNVMTRSHGSFGEMVDHERERALEVFDSGDITNGPGGSFSLDAPVRTERLDGAMLELLQSEEARALEYLQRISGGP
ncbi:MAG: hypothetical protein MPI95_08485, partial [Nitrosopumilus sp.]|nr:hypothetical protein [Nitrosopumilus sp.]